MLEFLVTMEDKLSNTTVKTEHKFSKIRSLLWPIYSYELKKVIPMGLLLFCMLFEYTIVRILKDGFIVNAAGASLISFLKPYAVLPAAILFVPFYAFLNKKYNKKTVFYMITIGFGLFFFIFGNFIFPRVDSCHISREGLAAVRLAHPRLGEFIAMAGLWSFSLFYVMAELLGTVFITQMFWQFANEITTTDESKRFYITFQSISNYALVIAAFTIENIFSGGASASMNPSKIKFACNLVALFTIISTGLYYYINKVIAVGAPIVKEVKVKVKKAKPTLLQSAKIILSSRYLAYIAMLLMCYGITINLVEITWKDLISQYSRESGVAMQVIQAQAFKWTGITAVVIATFGKSLVAILGWRITALVTPVGMLVTGMLFFGSVLSPELVLKLASLFGYTALAFGVLIGTMQNVFAKSTKYVLFDVTKEMSYIPLDATLKDEGKAAVEVIGSRLGKAAGGFVQSGLILLTGLRGIPLAPYLCITLIIGCLVWIAAVNLLAIDYNTLLQKQASHSHDKHVSHVSHEHDSHDKNVRS